MLFQLLLLTLLSLAEAPKTTQPYLLSNPKNKQNQAFKSHSLGHLLSSNNTVLPDGKWSAGSMYVGYGLSNNWTIATSPFVTYSFSMLNLTTRAAYNLDKKRRIGFDLGYFKTYGNEKSEFTERCALLNGGFENDACAYQQEQLQGYKTFKMEAWSFKFTYNKLVLPYYRFNSTISYFYYIDARRPFSLRMDPQNNDKYALNLSTLHEFRLKPNKFLNAEIGLWGLNYEYLYYHTGLSYSYQRGNWLWNGGLTSTFSPSFPHEKERRFNYYKSRLAVHPEIQIQYFF
jgi:hypothetical protein